MMFANATMHPPAYGRLFFAQANVNEAGGARQQFFDSAAVAINKLWQVVEAKLEHSPYLGGQDISPPADILLAVYSRWGGDFFPPVDIVLGPRSRQMVDAVLKRDSMQLA